MGATMAQHEGAAVFTRAMFTALTTVAVSSPPEKHREYDDGGSTTMNGQPTPSRRWIPDVPPALSSAASQ